MIFFRYRRYLEKQVEDLKAQNTKLELKNDELVRALVPVLRKMSESSRIPTNVEAAPVAHKKVSRTPSSYVCSCGASFTSSDPGELQGQISSHYRKVISEFRPPDKRWPALRNKLESTEGEIA